MSKTEQNLKDAFAGESQANRKYLAFGEKAKREGYPQVAKNFFEPRPKLRRFTPMHISER
jgi:rubrerythrin